MRFGLIIWVFICLGFISCKKEFPEPEAFNELVFTIENAPNLDGSFSLATYEFYSSVPENRENVFFEIKDYTGEVLLNVPESEVFETKMIFEEKLYWLTGAIYQIVDGEKRYVEGADLFLLFDNRRQPKKLILYSYEIKNLPTDPSYIVSDTRNTYASVQYDQVISNSAFNNEWHERYIGYDKYHPPKTLQFDLDSLELNLKEVSQDNFATYFITASYPMVTETFDIVFYTEKYTVEFDLGQELKDGVYDSSNPDSVFVRESNTYILNYGWKY